MTLHPRALVLLVLVAALCQPLAGCGNKGSLVRPPATYPDDAPPATELPPPTEPTEADPPAEIDPPPGAGAPTDPSTGPTSGDGDG